jgi:hypothetical protein
MQLTRNQFAAMQAALDQALAARLTRFFATRPEVASMRSREHLLAFTARAIQQARAKALMYEQDVARSVYLSLLFTPPHQSDPIDPCAKLEVAHTPDMLLAIQRQLVHHLASASGA